MDGEVLSEGRARQSRRLLETLGRRLLAAWLLLESWQERARQRRALLALDDRLLKDIGVSRADALHEGRKPFWKR